MLKTLPESRPHRARRTGGTALSVIIHATLIASAVALTIPHTGGATIPPEPVPIVTYVTPPVKELAPAAPRHETGPTTPAFVKQIQAPTMVLDHLPPITVASQPVEDLRIGKSISTDDVFFGHGTGSDGARTTGPASTSVYDVQYVERIPRVIGSPAAPRYPSSLRANGVSGSVVAKFVVDTTGRAELTGLEITESSHDLFSDAVREALSRYRFAPGEVSGRKVRTMVLMPFTFSVH